MHFLFIFFQFFVILFFMLLRCLECLDFCYLNSLENWSFEMMVLLSGLLPNPALETSVLSIWLDYFFVVLV